MKNNPNGTFCTVCAQYFYISFLGVEDNKYPRLEMSDEELKMAAKEGMTFPKFYPLTR